jgi:hypothetical protein
MRNILNGLVLILVILTVTGLSQTGNAKVFLVDFDEDQAEFLMLQAINTIRYNERLPLLCLDDNLAIASQRHAMDMAQQDYFGHYSLDGSSPDDRARNVGLPNPIQENIGIIRTFGQDLDEVIDALMDGFMESPQHMANILDPDLTHVGIGFYQDLDGSNHRLTAGSDPDAVYRGYGTVLVVQDFYRRRVTVLEPLPYHGWTKPGEFVTMRLDFLDDVEDAFLRIESDDEPGESFDVPMSKGDGGYRARFAIEKEGRFRIGIYANSPATDWFYREQGHLELTVVAAMY